MLPLSATATPSTVSELSAAIQSGLEGHGLSPKTVEATGSALSSVEKLLVDISGAQLTRSFRPPAASGKISGEAVKIAAFEFVGAPIYLEKAPAEVRLVASQVKAGLDFSDGKGVLTPISAGEGNVTVEIAREAVETLLHTLAVEAAKKQGLEVKKTTVTFTQEGPRVVAFRAEVTAKVFVMTAALALTGRISIDDSLNAKISNLKLDGDGMILKLAGSFAKPHLDRLEGRVFPLLAFAPGGLKLRDVEISAGEKLRVHAVFGA